MIRARQPFLAALPLFLALGCGTEENGAANGGNGAPRGTGPGDWTAGDYPPDLTGPNYLEITGLDGQQDNTRQYKVHVPAGYDPNVPMPLVFCLHGLGQNAPLFCVNGADMVPKSDQAGFILVMPNAIKNQWNAGTCCAGDPVLDDVGFVRAMFEEVGTHVNVDLDRVYATGLSNGGFMSYRLACEAADIFAAVAPSAGALTANELGWGNLSSDFPECVPSHPVSVLDLHGTADGIVPFELQAKSLELISKADGCATATAPALAPVSAGDTTCVSYSGCPNGIEVTGCSVEGGGHAWFGDDGCGTGIGPAGCNIVGANSTTLVNTEEVWAFFSRHSK